MTKYEWETELKKNIHRLPPDEIDRVLAYYGELFDDHAERGKRETEIVAEFGNPIDVADKILAEYDSENPKSDDGEFFDRNAIKDSSANLAPKSQERGCSSCGETNEKEFVEPPQKSVTVQNANASGTGENGVRAERVILFALLTFFTGAIFFVAVGVVWIGLCVFSIAGLGAGLGGLFTSVVSLGLVITGKVGAGLAQLGVGVAAVGLGIFLTILMLKLIKLCARATKNMFVKIGNWLSAKKESV